MKRTPVVALVTIVMLASLALGAAAGPAAAPDAPTATLFSYQGQVSDAAGNPITNPALPVTFKLYSVASGGTACWTEAHTGGNAVAVTNGLFNVLLGGLTAIPASCLTGDVYLELVVNGETLSPRERMTSVLHAVEAGTLSSGATTRGSLAVSGGLTVANSVTINGSGSSLIATPQDVDISGTGALRFGNGTTWLGVDNNEITAYGGDGLHLQASGATTDVLVHTGLRVEGIGVFTRDKTAYAFALNSLNLAEATSTTGNQASLGFHNAGISEGYIKLGYGGGDRKFVFGADQTDMDGAFTGSLYVGNGPQTSSSGVYLGGDTNEHIALYEDGDQAHLFIAPWGGAGRLYDEVTIGSGSDYRTSLGVWGDVSTNGLLQVGQAGSGEGGEIVLRTGSSGNGWSIDNYYGTYRLHHDGRTYFSVSSTGAVSCGALVETNLQTKEERATSQIARFEEGDVLCWGIDQLELCSLANDRLVQAVADASGKPIVLGAEKVKVLGPVQRGDILVASAVPGYAMVNNEPRAGSVIAQALEDFDGKRGIIKAMIRKF
jgi:hypothetical protein